MERINVTKTFLPPLEEYESYLQRIWAKGQITNQGPLLLDFEEQTKKYLGVEDFHFVTNGTIALQVALKSLKSNGGEIITTPFSYVATTSAVLWEKYEPVFVDIEPDTFCIDASKIERAITKDTKAIVAVHVFGHPCDVEAIDAIGKKHGITVIYDGAHAFGARYKDRSLLSYGDISMCSFHATKLFHTIEGGALIVKDKKLSDEVEVIKRFGHDGDNYYMLGLNAKASEFQAAMGLCNLKYVDQIIEGRKKIAQLYDRQLGDRFAMPKQRPEATHNYAYYPVLFESETKLKKAVINLEKNNIFPRRYFHPSLNTLSYINNAQSCPVSEDISSRILCLPMYYGLSEIDINRICEVLLNG